MRKQILKGAAFIAVVFILGSVAAVITDRFIMPWLVAREQLRRFSFFQKMNERVTVINKTEQITVKEDYSVTKTSQNILPSIVSIITYDEASGNEGTPLKIRASQDIQKFIKTGLIVTSDGLIVSVWDEDQTAETEKKKLYKVLASDGREFDAVLKATDPYTRLAYYKVEAGNLAAPVFGNSDELESGEKVVIAGNATGEYQTSYSMGIIKEKDRTFTLLNSELSSSEMKEGAIIADALIERNNIGGPVIDFNGTVVGIANQIEKDGKKVGFIIPSNDVKESLDRVIRNGQVDRPVLGLYYLSINREIALLNHLPVSQGSLVYSFTGQQGLSVIKNSAADLAGIRIGDIIQEIDGERVTLDQPLATIISRKERGAEVALKVLRGKETVELKAKLQ